MRCPAICRTRLGLISPLLSSRAIISSAARSSASSLAASISCAVVMPRPRIAPCRDRNTSTRSSRPDPRCSVRRPSRPDRRSPTTSARPAPNRTSRQSSCMALACPACRRGCKRAPRWSGSRRSTQSGRPGPDRPDCARTSAARGSPCRRRAHTGSCGAGGPHRSRYCCRWQRP